MAETVLAWQPATEFQPVPGAEAIDRRGGRVGMSVAGLTMDLALRRIRPDLTLAMASEEYVLAIFLPGVAALPEKDFVAPATARELMTAMARHWRDGRFPRANYERRWLDILRIYLAMRTVLVTPSEHYPDMSTWTRSRQLAYWDAATLEFQDARGNW